MPNRSEVLLVEDDVATREWLAAMLTEQPDLHLAQACGTVAEALDWLQRHPVDILLTDLGLPDGSGREVIGRAAECNPACEILVLTIFGDEAHVLSAIDAGAGGYLLKDGSLASVRDHLACLRSGGSPLSPTIARKVMEQFRAISLKAGLPPTATAEPAADPAHSSNAIGTEPREPLTDREARILELVAQGLSNKQIAAAVFLAEGTVKNYVSRIMEKLHASSRVELALRAGQRR